MYVSKKTFWKIIDTINDMVSKDELSLVDADEVTHIFWKEYRRPLELIQPYREK